MAIIIVVEEQWWADM